MKYDKIKLIRDQVSKKINMYKNLKNSYTPVKGWIRSIRTALGMNTRQLAKRVNVTKQRISVIEKQEIQGSLTINTLRKVADALGCVFVYGFLPDISLEDTVEKQAKLIVKEQMKHISQSMLLENQELSSKEKQKSIEDAIEKLLRNSPESIWE
ncbi:MAG: mobile mystery protein A [Candidatus Aureabacteria bacterium]|nr:mobile mystery protein A [Candidatus Auribacterota bacterium]